jgi:hypothetical protein
VLTFFLAVVLTAVVGSPLSRSLFGQERDTGNCTGVAVDLAWTKDMGVTIFGALTLERAGNDIKFTFAKLQDPITTTKQADHVCKVDGKDHCVEVFGKDGPDNGIPTTEDINSGPNRVLKAGSRHCAHYKAFVVTPCAGTALQIIKQTLTVDGKAGPNPGWQIDTAFGGAQAVDGPAICGKDAPGQVVPKGVFPPKKMTIVDKKEFFTSLICEVGPVAFVEWSATTTIEVGPAEADFKSSTVSTKPIIHCKGTAGYNAAATGPFSEAKKNYRPKDPKELKPGKE